MELDQSLEELLELRRDLSTALKRVNALMARTRPDDRPPERIGDFVLDRAAGRALICGEELPLSPREFAILSYLFDRLGNMVTFEELIERVWGGSPTDLASRKSLRVHVHWLREKLEGRVAFQIATVMRRGYRIDLFDAAPKAAG